MALTSCRECGGTVSTEAFACPHCGAPIEATAATLSLSRPRSTWGYEWRSDAELFGLPWVHIAIGRNEAGRLRVAKGIIAIGQFAVGVVTIAQFGVGLLFGFGQFMLGLTAVAQFAGALLFGLGQFATGYAAVGQMFISWYGLGQMGLAVHAWTADKADPAAVAYFCDLFNEIGLPVLPERCRLPPAEMPPAEMPPVEAPR